MEHGGGVKEKVGYDNDNANEADDESDESNHDSNKPKLNINWVPKSRYKQELT